MSRQSPKTAKSSKPGKPARGAKTTRAAASPAPFKAAAKKGAAPAKSPKAGKAQESQGAIGSLKKMLGLGGAKSAAAQPHAAGKKKGAAADAPAEKTTEKSKSAGKAAAPAGAVEKPAAGKGAKAPGAAPGRGGKGRNKGISDLPRTQLETSLRPRKDTAAESIAHGAPVCREVACELMATTGGYCRMHYIKNWKKIKRKEIILREKKLNNYIEELVSKYPDKYIEAIRQDLASEKDFAKVISDLEIDEGMDDFESVESEAAEGLIDNLKRDFDDSDDVF